MRRVMSGVLAVVLAVGSAGCGPSEEEVLAEALPELHAAVVDLAERVRMWEDVELWTRYRQIADELVSVFLPGAVGPIERIAELGEGLEDYDALDEAIAATPLPETGGAAAAALTRALAEDAVEARVSMFVGSRGEELAAVLVPAMDANERLRARLVRFDAETYSSSSPAPDASVADLVAIETMFIVIGLEVKLMIERLMRLDR